MLSVFLMLFRVLFFLMIAGMLVAFISANPQPVAVSLYPLPYAMHIALHTLCLGMFFLGLAVGGFAVYGSTLKSRWRQASTARKASKRIRTMEQELTALHLESVAGQLPRS